MEAFVEGRQREAQGFRQALEAGCAIERDVTIARAGIPPAQALQGHVGGLKQGREQDEARIGQQPFDLREDPRRVGGVLEDLEAGDEIESPPWAWRRTGARRDRRSQPGGTPKPEQFGQHSLAPAVVERRSGRGSGNRLNTVAALARGRSSR